MGRERRRGPPGHGDVEGRHAGPGLRRVQGGLARTGATPTLLFGYGGFYVGQRAVVQPIPRLWLEAGGVYAMAILRGGGEFGEDWHRAGI